MDPVLYQQVETLASDYFERYGAQALQYAGQLASQLSGPAYSYLQRRLEDYIQTPSQMNNRPNLRGTPMDQDDQAASTASSTANQSTQANDNTDICKVDYNIPGYRSEVTLAAGKALPTLAMSIGKQLVWDNAPDLHKQMNQKAVMSFDFKFQMSSDVDKRKWIYNAFRHRWSGDGTVQTGAIDSGGWPDHSAILQPRYATNWAYDPTGVINETACIEGKEGLTMFAGVNISDLEDMSYDLMYNKQAIRPFVAPTVDGPIENLLPSSSNCHLRISYPHYLNRGFDVGAPNTDHMAPPQIHTGLNRGVVTYNFNNTNIHPCRVEAVVLKVKKTAKLPATWSSYAKTNAAGQTFAGKLLTDYYETALGENYVHRGQRFRSTDIMGGGVREPTDVTINPKVKFLPAIPGEDASRIPFTEVSRQGFVLGAGDKRQLIVKLPGTKYNPFTKHSGAQATETETATFDAIPPFDQNCYYVALAINGLISQSRLMSSNDVARHVDGTVFTEANVMVEGNYTEYIQAATFKEQLGRRMYTHGRLLEDTYTYQGMERVPITIVPPTNVVVSTGPSQILSDATNADGPILNN